MWFTINKLILNIFIFIIICIETEGRHAIVKAQEVVDHLASSLSSRELGGALYIMFENHVRSKRILKKEGLSYESNFHIS